jgi:hypothetical protein
MDDHEERNHVDDYIALFKPEVQERLSQVRQVIREAASLPSAMN